MDEPFTISLADLQPSQLYICRDKLAAVTAGGAIAGVADVRPMPVRRLDGRLVLTDGHTRAFAAFQAGLNQVRAYWENEELDWEAYRICVDWCIEEGIVSIADLQMRLVGADDYERLWYARCRAMHAALKAERGG